MDYKTIKPGLKRRLAYSENLKRRMEQNRMERQITVLERRQRNFFSYENLVELEDVVVSCDISKNSIFHLNDTIKFCNICQEDIEELALVRITYCNHIYHYTCLGLHCMTSNKCPTCRSIFN